MRSPIRSLTHRFALQLLIGFLVLASHPQAGSAQRKDLGTPVTDRAPAAARVGRQEQVFRGIYSLQDSLQFDNLQAVVHDPRDDSLTLLGERFSDEWLLSVPYLDHLATAIESNHPSFTLPWEEQASRQVGQLIRTPSTNTDLWDRITRNARRQLFNPQHRLTDQGLRILKTLNFPCADYEPFLTNKYDVMARTFAICGGEQQATVIGAYARSLRDPTELNAALKELAMSKALDTTMTGPGSTSLWEIFLRRFADVLDLNGTKSVEIFRRGVKRGDHVIIARKAAVENTLAAVEPAWAKIFPNSLELSAAKKSHIHLPPDLVRSLAKITIHVNPTWNRIAPKSSLAEVMFESDLLLKWIISDPTLLGTNLSSHKTEYEWNQRKYSGKSTSTLNNVRFWISPDVIELAESDDRTTLEFRKFTMRINTNDPASRPYVEYLTSIYEGMASEIPTLHELRECAKLIAVAEWLKKKNASFRFPKEGRRQWEPPEWVFGFITIDSTVRTRRTDTSSSTRITGKWNSTVAFEGGVSLGLGKAAWTNGNVLFDGARGPRANLGTVSLVPSGTSSVVVLDDLRTTIVPEIYDNQTLKRVLAKKTIPPPPTPAGVTARATVGKRKLQYLRVLGNRLDEQAMTEEMQKDYKRAIELARKLEVNDKLLNELSAGLISPLQAFQQAEKWARAEREQFLYDLLDMATAGLSSVVNAKTKLEFRTNMAELLYAKHRAPRHWLMITSRYAPKAKGLLGDINTARKSVESGEHFDRNFAIADRSIELLGEVNKSLEVVPRSTLVKRFPGYTSLAINSAKGAAKIGEIHVYQQEINSLSELVGQKAKFAKTLQDRQVTYLKELQAVTSRLERRVSK